MMLKKFFGREISVLLLEDDPLDARLVERALSKTTFASTLKWVASIDEAATLAQENKFDVILSDLSLTDSFGSDTLHRLQLGAPDIPIIVLSSLDDLDLGRKMLEEGAQDYIAKESISGDVIGRAIRHAIQRQEQVVDGRNLLRELEAARELLSSKNKKLEVLSKQALDFVDNVSHEFRTPLTVIKEYASLICEGVVGDVNAEQRRMLNVIENRAFDLNTIVDDMLDSSKLHTGLIGARRKPCEISQILEHVTTAMERKSQAKGATLTWDIAPDLPTLYCDPEKIGRVLINLVTNALKFCGDPGSVRVSAFPNPSGLDVTFAIEDDGAGIHEENLKQIFQRFQQLNTTSRDTCKGFGLGLPIAQELVELNFGKLSVESELGRGSKFIFSVPKNSPQHVVTRYLTYVANSRVFPHIITLVSARAITYATQDQLDDTEDFLNSVCRCSDLLIRCHDGSFLMALPTDGRELQSFVTRGQEALECSNRNRPYGPLPEITYSWVGTWQIDEERDAVLQAVREFTCDRDTICV